MGEKVWGSEGKRTGRFSLVPLNTFMMSNEAKLNIRVQLNERIWVQLEIWELKQSHYKIVVLNFDNLITVKNTNTVQKEKLSQVFGMSLEQKKLMIIWFILCK